MYPEQVPEPLSAAPESGAAAELTAEGGGVSAVQRFSSDAAVAPAPAPAAAEAPEGETAEEKAPEDLEMDSIGFDQVATSAKTMLIR